MTMTASGPKAVTQPDQRHLLHIYLRDHEAASAGGVELFRRCSKSNQGTPYAAELQRLANEVQSDREALRDICRQLDVRLSKVGEVLAVAGVTVGRLKPNGRIFSYSLLSRVIELELMSSGVLSRRGLWESLLRVAAHEPRLDTTELTLRVALANDHLETLRSLHERAIDDAFI